MIGLEHILDGLNFIKFMYQIYLWYMMAPLRLLVYWSWLAYSPSQHWNIQFLLFLGPRKGTSHRSPMQTTKRSLISALAPIHIWDYEDQKPYLRYTMELYFKKDQWGSWAGSPWTEIWGYSFSNLSLKFQPKQRWKTQHLVSLHRKEKIALQER